PPVEHFNAQKLKQFIAAGKTLVDLRDASSFGGAHVPGSINIGFSPQVANWLGVVVDPEEELVILGATESDIDEALLQFRRAGYDRIVGYVIGIAEWVAQGEETGILPQLSVHGLQKLLTHDEHTVIDVRTDQEWRAGHIKGAQHIPIQQIIENSLDVGKEEDMSIICGSGYRSNIAGSFLKAQGFTKINSVIGGMNAWNRKYEVEK
ncbi:MAG: rhodanese-like domain-containing protein, partial [Thermodesulfobacteriota bacterium]|nr:rhodanese-like domain-containing protein [Thermodesulfobacteriota bacterium]